MRAESSPFTPQELKDIDRSTKKLTRRPFWRTVGAAFVLQSHGYDIDNLEVAVRTNPEGKIIDAILIDKESQQQIYPLVKPNSKPQKSVTPDPVLTRELNTYAHRAAHSGTLLPPRKQSR